MAVFELKNQFNENIGEVELNDAIVEYPIKPWLLHEVVIMQLASKRAGTHQTKNRAIITGGGKKPFRQKGTGRARAGSTRSPLWKGGATIFGPQPRDYSYSMPKKKIKNALKSALRAKIDDGAIIFVEELKIENGKTKEAVEILNKFNADRKVLIVYSSNDEKMLRAFRNIPYVKLLNVNGLNVYDLVNSRTVLILKESLPRIMEVLG